MSLTLPSVVLQDLTFTAVQLGGDITITYQNGGTAGAELVTVTDGRAITVQIKSGTSTATQIKTAMDAHSRASSLVTTTISGTGSNVQLSCVLATLSGGLAAIAASKTLYPLNFVAKTAGTAGNSITVTYHTGSLACSVSSTAISITFPVGTLAPVVAAKVNTTSAASALVVCSAMDANTAPLLAQASSAKSLAGGAAAVAASHIVQDLTFSQDVAGTAGNGATITYVDDAEAGSETVAVVGQAVTVHIDSGESTATQINTALTASDAFNGANAKNTVTVVDYTKAHLTAATGNITVTNFANLHLTKATGTVTVADYTQASAVSATGTYTVVDYTKLSVATATPSGTITYGTPSTNDTVIITGLPTDGTKTFTKVASSPGPNQFAAITDLTALINTLADLNATDNGTVITMTVATAGSAMNSVTVTGTGSFSGLSRTFSGGQDNAIATVNGTAKTAGTNWTAATSNNATATSLASALNGISGFSASAASAVVTVTKTATGTAGNSVTLATTGGANLTISGATMSGGRNATTVTVNGTALVANVDWTATASNNTTATNLAAAIGAIGGTPVDASASSAVITVTAHVAGTAANSYGLVTSNTGAVTVGAATLAGGIDASTVTVAGHILTESTNFNAVTSNNQTATNIAAAVDALSEVSSTASTNVVSIVATPAGTSGNTVTVTTSDGTNLAVNHSPLTGGINALVLTINGTAITESTDFNAVSSNNTTAANIATAAAITGYTAAASSAVVTITYSTRGTAGNAKTLATSSTAAATIGGATFSGGTDAFAVTTSGTGSTAQVVVNAVPMTGAVGSGPTAFYQNQSVPLTASYVLSNWGFPARVLIVSNDDVNGSNTVNGSWDGSTTGFTLLPGEVLTLDVGDRRGFFLKYTTGAPNYRIEVVG